MKNLLKECAKQCKISDIGFLKCENFSELLPVLSKDTPFVSCTPKERTNPFLLMEDAKTIIVLLFSYKTDSNGNISSYARGKDYHLVLKERSKPLISLLNLHGFKAEFFCDNASLNERFLAQKAGLGFIGKNGFLIHPVFGSLVFIAHIITDCEISPDTPLAQACASCNKCINACPTNALTSGDFYSCLSYITQKKGELTEHEKKLIKNSNMCWGCDICQNVCPHNENAQNTDIPEFCEDLITDLKITPMSNREFKKLYSDRAFSWRGKSVLERNLSIIDN